MHHGNFVAHGIAIREGRARQDRNAFALGGQAVKALASAAQKDRNPELELELFNAARQAGLADVASLRRAAEMTLLGDRKQILELPQEHALVLEHAVSCRDFSVTYQ